MRVATYLACLLCLIHSSLCKLQYTLNVPRVLLPFVPPSGIKSNFTLKSDHGCFSWVSTKPDIASVEAVYIKAKNGLPCSREAVLTAQSTQPDRLSTIIIATEEATGLTLRSDVYVDTISRIDITTRTRELLLEEEPEKFEVRAFDEEGNMFSTVRGHVFRWSLLKDEEAVHQELEPDAILEFVRFTESAYTTDNITEALETKGLQGDEVLVAGINTGTAKVQVKLVEKAWKSVSSSIVKLLVLENLMLLPSADQYIMRFSTVDYRVERRKHGKTEAVRMPSDQYSLDLTNTTVASLDRSLSRVTGLVIGDTELILNDKNMLNIPQATKPSADIHVVPPNHLGFSVAPGNVWALETGRDYTITVNIYDKLNHKILVTESVPLKTLLPVQYFHTYSSTLNQSHFHVRAIKPGRTTLTTTLKELIDPRTDKRHPLPSPLTKLQTVEIFEPIQVVPKQLVLLWDTASEHHYQHPMKARGGSGSFLWSSDQVDVVGVSAGGVATSVGPGKGMITASDVKNSAHFDTSLAYVVPPATMSFLPSKVEVVVGRGLLLPLMVQGYTIETKPTLLPFHDCRQMKFNVALSNKAIFNITMEHNISLSMVPEGACTVINATALISGHTKLTLTYDNDGKHLEASVTISSYLPLRPVDPASIAVVTLGSSKTVLFEGGPSPWVLDPSQFFKSLTAERPDDLIMTPLPSSLLSHHYYRILCRQLGEQTLTIEVGNGRTLKNSFPSNETAFIRMSCALPVSMVIRPVVKEMSDCPLLRGGNQNVQFPVQNSRTLDLEVVVFDAERRQFDNFSSLHFQWSSSSPSLLPTPSIKSLRYRGNRALMVVELSSSAGSVIVTAMSESHRQNVLNRAGVHFKDPFSPNINHSLSLLLRSDPVLSPSSLLLFNHPDNKGSLTIFNGSSHFRVDHMIKPRPPVADVEYIKDFQQVNIHPLGEGQIKVTVADLCLPVADTVSMVFVSSIYSVQVIVPDKVQVGSKIFAFVKVLDNRGTPFSYSQHKHMKLLANPKTEHITVRLASDDSLQSFSSEQLADSSVYEVKGVAMGTALLLFNVTTTIGKVVSSWPAEIQVFDPLRFNPREIVLIPTAVFQIDSTGGPLPHTAIDYSISNDTVARVDPAGLVTAVTPGTAVVTGLAMSYDPDPIVHSRDMVYVRVVQLTGVRIVIPTTKLVVGEEIAMHAEGETDETPFAFASSIPGLVFHWSVTNMDVHGLTSVYDKAGVSLQEEQDFASRLRSRNPGQGVIKLVMKCPPGPFCIPEQATFTDQVRVHVYPSLQLVIPQDGHLLLPQNGNTKIVTNRDGISKLTYRILQSCVDQEDGQPLVTVSPHGEVHTASFNGHAVILVTEHREELGLNQSVAVHVEVRPVSSLSLVPVSIARAISDSKQHAFPLGYSAHFSALLHDSVGRLFDYGGIGLSYRLNRFDIVQVTPGQGNDSYIIKAANQGSVILKVWVQSLPLVSDYVRVRVGYAILPSLAVVHIGATVCFTTHLTEAKPGYWSSGEEGVIDLDPDSGVAVAISTGRALVYHNVDGLVDTHTEISVARVKSAVFNITGELPTYSNTRRPDELGPYQLTVEFSHELGSGSFTPLTMSPNKACAEGVNISRQDNETSPTTERYLQQVVFECIAELYSYGNVLPASNFIRGDAVFDHVTGESSCVLQAVEDPSAVESLSVMEDVTLTLKARATDSAGTYEVFSDPVFIPFRPAFFIGERAVEIKGPESSSDVVLSGLPDQLQSIQVTSAHPLAVVQVSKSVNTATYRISLTDPHSLNFTDARITFTSSLTRQKEVVLVSYNITTTSAKTCPTNTGEVHETPASVDQYGLQTDHMNLVLAVITAIVLLLATIVVCLALKQSSRKKQDGFASRLPPAATSTSSPAFLPKTSTPSSSVSYTPLLSQSTGQSAFKRPAQYKFSPNRISPQHGLFSLQ